jgi:thiol-disulfide isomerase/thioredoxin
MKISIILLLTICISTSLFCQQSTKELDYRNLYQQSYFDQNHYKDFNGIGIRNAQQLDSLFDYLDIAWRKHVADSLVGKSRYRKKELENINAYNHIMNAFKMEGLYQLPKHIEIHLIKSYLLPSLKKDHLFLKEKIDSNNIHFLFGGNFHNAFTMSCQNFSDTSLFNDFYPIYLNYKELLITNYKTRINDSINNHRLYKNVYDANNLILDINPYVEANHFYINHEYDKSLEKLLDDIKSKNSYHFRYSVELAKKLIDYFFSIDEKEKSYSILNVLSKNIEIDQLSRDTLEKWYLQVMPGSKNNFITEENEGNFLFVSDTIEIPENLKWLNNEVNMKEIKSAKYIFIEFWATWCGACKAQFPELNKFYERIKNRKDVMLLSINEDFFTSNRKEKDILLVIDKMQVKFPMIYDNNDSKFNETLIPGYPKSYIIDGKGNVYSKTSKGVISINTFKTALDLLDKEKENN